MHSSGDQSNEEDDCRGDDALARRLRKQRERREAERLARKRRRAERRAAEGPGVWERLELPSSIAAQTEG